MHTKTRILFDDYLETNVFYQKDLDRVRKHFKPNVVANELSLGELLTGFFYFYTEFYDPSAHVISTAHRDSTFLSHSTYLTELHNMYRHVPFIVDGFL